MSRDDPHEQSMTLPTMHDVARLAGVSIKSVSRVINKEPHVSAKLRAKVDAAVDKLGYVPDPAARSLAGVRSFTLGVLFDVPSQQYTMKIQAGLYRACVEHQYHLRIEHIDSNEAQAGLEGALARFLRHSRVDALVLTPPLSDNAIVLDFLEANGILYSRVAPFLDLERSAGTRIDDEAAAAAIADLMWSHGHRSFGIINGPKRHGAAAARRKGFLARLKEHDPSIEPYEAMGNFDFVPGIAAGRKLMEQYPRPTAIFATNDDSAAGLMVAIREAGLSIPQDISVCGFDDSWVASSVWPLLTTVLQPIEQMAYVAACLVLQRPDPQAPTALQTLDYTVIERDSVGPAPA
jgi:LacI family transcriptional regulator